MPKGKTISFDLHLHRVLLRTVGTQQCCYTISFNSTLFDYLKQVARKWEEAGDLFIRAAELEDKAGESVHQAASAYMEASKCYKSADITEKVATASQAAQERFLEMGRFTQVMENTLIFYCCL